MASATQTARTRRKRPCRNLHAGRLLAAWRIDRGLSPEQLSWAMATDQLGHISGRQIRRIENEGVVPTPRVMFALAAFFGTTPSAVWYETRRASRA